MADTTTSGWELKDYFYLAHIKGEILEVRLKEKIKNDRHAYAVALNHYYQNLFKLYGQFEMIDLCRNMEKGEQKRSVMVRRHVPETEQKKPKNEKVVSSYVAPVVAVPESVPAYKLGVW
jgi:hypothetical protein